MACLQILFKHIGANFLEEGGVESFGLEIPAVSMNIRGISQACMWLICPHTLLSFKQSSFISLANNGKNYNHRVSALVNMCAEMCGNCILSCIKPVYLFYIHLIRKAHTCTHAPFVNLIHVEPKYIGQVCWQVTLLRNSAWWQCRWEQPMRSGSSWLRSYRKIGHYRLSLHERFTRNHRQMSGEQTLGETCWQDGRINEWIGK